ncbi:uncharacterized protein LOC6572261 [Drosophila mojavensis]|uniref:Tes134 n=2 Tax=Drosophila mojavensis TaxID=7230 RepID=B4KDN0_DROMO|nr:uncharacterized protein LOC6572261 [Drosophila mojavensis]EDW13864.1 Tes134 [Drosophila mojavensis]
MDDIFHDCRSESDCDRECAHKAGILKACQGDFPQEEPQQRKAPMDMRSIIRRAAQNTQILLRGLGVHCECTEIEEPPSTCKFFYPATLEISARVHTEPSCGVPPHCQCILRGSPVTLSLPMELEPHSGQVKVNIFKPAPNTLAHPCECAAVSPGGGGGGCVGAGAGAGAGDRRACGPPQNCMRRQSYRTGTARKAVRRVRWDA